MKEKERESDSMGVERKESRGKGGRGERRERRE